LTPGLARGEKSFHPEKLLIGSLMEMGKKYDRISLGVNFGNPADKSFEDQSLSLKLFDC
jgi:hypothetical protein